MCYIYKVYIHLNHISTKSHLLTIVNIYALTYSTQFIEAQILCPTKLNLVRRTAEENFNHLNISTHTTKISILLRDLAQKGQEN